MNIHAQSSDDIIMTSVSVFFFSNTDNNQSQGEKDEEPKSPSEQVKAELSDCPRDSGCYIGSDCSDTSKEDTETQPAPLSPPATQA